MADAGALAWVTLGALAALFTAAALLATHGHRTARGTASMAMPLLDHVEELRRRLLVIVAALLAGTLVAMLVRFDWHGAWPVPAFSPYGPLAAQLFDAAAQDLVPASVQLIVTRPMDGFMAQFSVAVGVGIALALPAAFVQAAGFLGPALQARERRLVAAAVVPGLLLFGLGAWFGYRFLLPVTFAALYGFSDALGATGYLTVSEFATFTLTFVVGCGVAFELPLVMTGLARLGVVRPAWFARYWRHAVVVILILAMVLTPDPTIVSQLILAVPLLLLYGVGILGATWAARRRDP